MNTFPLLQSMVLKCFFSLISFFTPRHFEDYWHFGWNICHSTEYCSDTQYQHKPQFSFENPFSWIKIENVLLLTKISFLSGNLETNSYDVTIRTADPEYDWEVNCTCLISNILQEHFLTSIEYQNNLLFLMQHWYCFFREQSCHLPLWSNKKSKKRKF